MSTESTPLYERVIYQNDDKFYQLRLVVSEFRDTQYIHLRKYFLSYEGEWIPSKEGVSMVAEMGNVYSLLEGLIEICSYEESRDAVRQFFTEKLDNVSESNWFSKPGFS